MGRFVIIKSMLGFCVVFKVVNVVVTPTLRYATGWKDWESHEVNQEAIDKFIKQNEGKPVIKLKEGENYF